MALTNGRASINLAASIHLLIAVLIKVDGLLKQADLGQVAQDQPKG